MSNSTTKNILYFDTFSPAVNIGSWQVMSIEWSQPSTVAHTCVIKSDGIPLISWTCAVQHEGYIKYFNGLPIKNITIDNNGVGSGVVIIHVR